MALLSGHPFISEEMIERSNERFTFGTIFQGPGSLQSFGFNIMKDEDKSITLHSHDNRGSLALPWISRMWRRGKAEQPKATEGKHMPQSTQL